MQPRVTIQSLYSALHERLALTWHAGQGGRGRGRNLVDHSEERGGHILAGSLNLIHPNRIQVVGKEEATYLDELDPITRSDTLKRVFSAEPAAIILADDLPPDEELILLANEHCIPLLTSPLPESRVVDHLQYYGALFLAEKTNLHGVFLEVLGMGVLLTGEPAVGKSELALELISRGSRLIADDAPEFTRLAPDIVSGACPPLLKHFLEVRGLGLLNIRSMFGDSAIKRTKYLRLIVHLAPMNEQQMASLDRLSGTYGTTDVLGLKIPQVTVPVAPGRNLAILVEAAVRNHMLKLKGYDAGEDFIARQQQAIQDSEKN